MNLKMMALAAALAAPLAHADTADTAYTTGVPAGTGLAYSITPLDWMAERFVLAQDTTVDGIVTWMSAAVAGDRFTLSLYQDGSVPGALLYSSTATFGTDGWNGATGLGWTLGAGSYWVGVEVHDGDTLSTDAYLDEGLATAPAGLAYSNLGSWSPLAATATRGFGLQVSAVPEPGSLALLLAGVAALGVLRRRRD